IQPFVAPSEMTYVLVLGEPRGALEGQDLASTWGIEAFTTLAPVADEGFITPPPSGPPAQAQTSPPPATQQQTAPPAAPPPAQHQQATPPALATPPPTPAQPEPAEDEGPALLGEPVIPQCSRCGHVGYPEGRNRSREGEVGRGEWSGGSGLLD